LLFHPLSELFPDLREGCAQDGKKYRPIQKYFPSESQALMEIHSSLRNVQHQGGMEFAQTKDESPKIQSGSFSESK